MNKVVIFVVSVILVAGGWWWYATNATKNQPNLDAFAQCLADQNVVMYGAAWCPHCQNEKRAFGKSFRLVPYVECPDNPKECLKKGVEAYPTWIFPDGRRFVGEQGLQKLSQESSCPLPANAEN